MYGLGSGWLTKIAADRVKAARRSREAARRVRRERQVRAGGLVVVRVRVSKG